MTPCPPRDRLADLLAERLPPPETAAVEQHVEACPDCQAALAALVPPSSASNDPARWEPAPTFLHRLRAAGAGGVRAAGPLPNVPGYAVVRPVGRGGAGVVYEAVQVALGRRVALKMLRDAPDAEALARFRREAAAVARLNHPNVVRIYDVGEHDGLPFFTMELVEGGTLAERLKGQPCPPREAAAAVETLARAVHAAHAQGIVHRDLKPHNVLIGDGPPPSDAAPTAGPATTAGARPGDRLGPPEALKIVDFGLARDVAAGSDLTATGQVMGTPGYMAPEQAGRGGGRIGPAADVYALGAILYELVTGRPPFAGPTPVETILQVVSADPVPPRRLNPGIPKDLETVALKCLQKDPARRYPSAGALAGDLAAFRANRPIRARPAGTAERAWRWCRRNPGPALAVALAALLLGAGTVAALALADRERRHAARLADEKKETEDALAKVDANYLLLREADRGRRQALVNSAHLLQERAQAAGEAGEVAKALLLLDRSLATLPADEVAGRASVGLYAAAWRPFLHPVRLTLDTGEPVYGLAVSPNGTRWATSSNRGDVALWDARTGRRVGQGATRRPYAIRLLFSPDGRYLLSANPTGFALRDARTGAVLHDVPDAGTTVRDVTFAPDSSRLLTLVRRDLEAEVEVRVWDVAAGRPAGEPIRAPLTAGTPYFAPDGRVRFLGTRLATPVLWDPGQPAPPGPGPGTYGTRVARHPHGPWAGTAAGMTATLWQEANGKFNTAISVPLGAEVRDLCFTADGGYLLTLSARRLSVVAVPRRAVVTLELPAAEFDRIVPAAGGPGFVLTGPGGVLVGDAQAGTLHLERVPYWPPFRNVRFASPRLPPAGLAPDGTLVLAEAGSTVRARATTPYGPACVRVPVGSATDPVFSPDGRHLILAEPGRRVRLWDRAAGRLADEAIPLPAEAVALAVRPDRPELLVWTADGAFSFFDLATRQRVGEPVPLGDRGRDPGARPGRRVALSPDGRQWLAFGDRWVWVWDLPTRARVAAIPLQRPGDDPAAPDGRYVDAAAFSPDGRWVAHAGYEGRVDFWDRPAGAAAARRLDVGRPIRGLWFSPDGARLVCLMLDGTVETWDLRAGSRVGDVPAAGGRLGLGAVVGDPTGRLVCAGGDAAVLVDPATGKSVGPPLSLPALVGGMALDPAGRTLAICTATETQLIDVPADAGADPARPSIEVLTGLSIDPRGTLVPLTTEAWHAHRRPPAGEHPD